MPSVLFASNHCYLDFASGAALAMRDLLMSLAKRGWYTQVLCGSMMDTQELRVEPIITAQGLPFQSRRHESDACKYSVYELRDAGVEVRVYDPGRWSNPIALSEGYPFLQLVDEQLRQRRPDVILSFGGGWLERGLLAVARRHGVPVVFWLRNTEYRSADLFASVAGAIVPSRFTARHYQEKFHLDCQVIPSLILLDRVLCAERWPRYVTFVSPTPNKGIFYFARIASELGRLRPDIPILVVVGRGNAAWLDQTGLNLRGLPSLKVMPASKDPRDFYRVTRAIVAPVLWEETFLRTAAEGILNGIPTLASRRGGVPETLGQSGFLFDVAPHHTPASRRVPTVREVRPWIDIIQRLFDEPPFAAQQQQKCLTEATRFAPEGIIAAHENYLAGIAAARSTVNHSTQSLAGDLAFLQRFFKTPIKLENFPAI